MSSLTLPKSATIPAQHTVIEREGRRYNVTAESGDAYAVASAFLYADGTARVLILWWDKADCRVVEYAAP